MERNFAAVMSELRHARGLSQRKVAADLKISQALLSHYENGIREPGLAFVVRACDYYQVSADYLLGRQRERGPGWEGTDAQGTDSAVLSSTADLLTQLCLELCRREPESKALFHCLAGQLKQALAEEKKSPSQREKGPQGGEGEIAP